MNRFAKNRFLILLAGAVLMFGVACSNEEEEVSPLPDDGQNDPDIIDAPEPIDPAKPKAPIWINSAPKAVNGASTMDISLGINGTGYIYYAVYTEDPGFPAPADLKQAASSATTNKKIVAGKVKIEAASVNKLKEIFLEELPYESTLHTYAVAEYADADTSILQTNVWKSENTLPKRQTEEWFQSAAENRQGGFLAYKPEAFYKKPGQKLPLMIFLGGNGEVAKQGEFNLLRNQTVPWYIDRGRDFECIVISPQHIKNDWNADFINEVVEEAVNRYPVDESRIYMTGISGGGFGTFRYAVKYPEKLAAIVPIAGGGDNNKACELVNMAVWAFHGDADGIVAASNSINMIDAINACNPKPDPAAKLTIYPGVTHNSWARTYDGSAGHDVFAWLLKHKK